MFSETTTPASDISLMDRPRLLVVEDDEAITEILELGLAYEGYEVTVVREGVEAVRAQLEHDFDLVVLDLMLPGIDGMSVLARIRDQGDTPVIVLTAVDALPDRVRGLDAGADDYLTKPFEFPELVARIRAILRRRGVPHHDVIEIADLLIDRRARTVVRAGEPIDLTARQFDLLVVLATNARKVMTKEELYQAVWGWEYLDNPNVVEQQISQLRRRVERAASPPLIRTVRGVGYVLKPEENTW